MKLITFTSVILIGLVINNAIRRSNARSKKIRDEFWERERSSRATPGRSTEDLKFIQFPDDLPLHISTDDPQIKEYQETLVNITKKPVINLSGISNTDIRLAYGAPNMEELSRADERFIVLCRTLNNLADSYGKEGYKDEGTRLLEFAVSEGSDIKETWTMLGQFYLDAGNTGALSDLIAKAGKLNDDLPYKEDILTSLKDFKKLSDIVS
ncbi:MAG: hypothetical protein IJT63_05985 [Lachnospiraceae bacterium]|nr:hypothetical protein [Lachnospiraceae bacterium]